MKKLVLILCVMLMASTAVLGALEIDHPDGHDVNFYAAYGYGPAMGPIGGPYYDPVAREYVIDGDRHGMDFDAEVPGTEILETNYAPEDWGLSVVLESLGYDADVDTLTLRLWHKTDMFRKGSEYIDMTWNLDPTTFEVESLESVSLNGVAVPAETETDFYSAGGVSYTVKVHDKDNVVRIFDNSVTTDRPLLRIEAMGGVDMIGFFPYAMGAPVMTNVKTLHIDIENSAKSFWISGDISHSGSKTKAKRLFLVRKRYYLVPEGPGVVYEPRCGDGICETGENGIECPVDCPPGDVYEPVCGDGRCEGGEDNENCPEDCPPAEVHMPREDVILGELFDPIRLMSGRFVTAGRHLVTLMNTGTDSEGNDYAEIKVRLKKGEVFSLGENKFKVDIADSGVSLVSPSEATDLEAKEPEVDAKVPEVELAPTVKPKRGFFTTILRGLFKR